MGVEMKCVLGGYSRLRDWGYIGKKGYWRVSCKISWYLLEIRGGEGMVVGGRAGVEVRWCGLVGYSLGRVRSGWREWVEGG